LLVDSSGVVKLADFGMAKHVSCNFPLYDILFNKENGLLVVHILWIFNQYIMIQEGICISSSGVKLEGEIYCLQKFLSLVWNQQFYYPFKPVQLQLTNKTSCSIYGWSSINFHYSDMIVMFIRLLLELCASLSFICSLVWIMYDIELSFLLNFSSFHHQFAASSYFALIIIVLESLFPQLTGHSADLSLKGSPYWMAPEVYLYIFELYITLMYYVSFTQTCFSYSLCKRSYIKIIALI